MATLPNLAPWTSLRASVFAAFDGRRGGIWLDRIALGFGAFLWVAFVFIVVHAEG
jgi:hypothetical protein